MAYERVLLKLSGEVFGGEAGAGLNLDAIERIARQVRKAANFGVQIAVVIGGGNILRGAAFGEKGMNRSMADYMGMLGTIINAVAFQDALERLGVETRVLSALHVQEVSEPFILRRAVRHLERGRVVILAGGTGNPFFTTDTTAALRAQELRCDVLLKGTKVDGIYDSDPVGNPDAKRFTRISFNEVLERELGIMDAAAVAMCRGGDLPILVFDMLSRDNIVRAVRGEAIGTLVGPSGS